MIHLEFGDVELVAVTSTSMSNFLACGRQPELPERNIICHQRATMGRNLTKGHLNQWR